MADALAGKDFVEAITFLRTKRDALTLNDTFLLTYPYCLNGNIDKAQALGQATVGSLRKDALADWLWGN
jgi:hypothetical protein